MLAHTLRRWTPLTTSLKKCSSNSSYYTLCSPGRSTSTSVPSVLSKGFRSFGSLPKHDVMGLPALSPTMEVGTIVKWNMKEGHEFGPGDVFADVETDKATIAFEAVDDGILAKILVPEGVPDVPVGTPILVTVENKEDVAAFVDYKADSSSSSEVSKPKQDDILKQQDDSSVNAAPNVQRLPTTPAMPTPSTITLPKPAAPAVTVPHVKEEDVVRTSTTATAKPPTTSHQSTSRHESILRRGENIKNGPLYHRILQHQVEYIAKYGTTGTDLVDNT